MGSKKIAKNQLQWLTSSPSPFVPGTAPSGVTSGVMSGTNTIYSQILDVTNTDNQGIEITWTGTPTGTVQVMGSIGGTNFYALTFNPALTQPAGSGGGYLVDLNQYPFSYLMIQYTNSSGSGVLSGFEQQKDVN